MDPQLATGIYNSDTTKIVAKRLWPSMLFLVVMSIISACAIAFFNERGSLSWTISYWIWFVIFCGVIVVGSIVLMMDARILNSKDRFSPTE